MTTKLTKSNAKAWDKYAAAALSGYLGLNMAAKKAVPAAVEAADALLEQRILRRKANGDYKP